MIKRKPYFGYTVDNGLGNPFNCKDLVSTRQVCVMNCNLKVTCHVQERSAGEPSGGFVASNKLTLGTYF